jgi:UDP-glucose 4-epimerase
VKQISNNLQGKTLVITGGTGTFGSEVLRHYLHTDIGEIRIFSRDEKKQDDLRNIFGSGPVKYYLGDVRDLESLRDPMKGADFVFHAAALKQVPSCEFFPLEAIRTNVLGTENVLNSSIAAGVKKLIVLSTDKAVYPINAMGMSKALMEKLMIAKARKHNGEDTVFCGIRYGNVMGSRGSVVPLFLSQILAEKPITITDPTMTRFMMVIDDAIDLVVYALDHASSGDIFVQKTPAATIESLVMAMKQIFNSKSEVRIIGTRHGEKRHETLLNREELSRSEDLGEYYRVPADMRGLEYSEYLTVGQEKFSRTEEYSSDNSRHLTVEEVVELLLRLDIVRDSLNGKGCVS